MIGPLPRAGIAALSATLALTGPGIIGAGGGIAGAQALQRHSSASTVTLTIWNDLFGTPPPGVSNADFWPTKALKMFQAQNAHIQVKVVPTPQDAQSSFAALLKSSEVAGNTPDVAGLFAGGQILQNANYLLQLNKYISPTFKQSLYTGWQFATKDFKTSGPVYGVPYGAGYYYFVYYNKALFKKAGVNTTSLPTTWPQLITLAKQLKSHGILPFQFGEKDGYYGAWTQDALISSEVGTQGVLNMFAGKLSLNSPTIIRAYTAWHELYADGLTNSDALSLDNNQSTAQFAKGNGAMTITGGFSNGSIEVGSMKTNVGIFPVPALPGAKFPKILSGGPNNDYVIFKNTKYPAQAMQLVKFLVSPQVQEMALDQGFGQLPDNTTYVAGATLQKVDPVLAQTYQYIRVKHYGLAEAFDNIMPGSIDSYWYQTNSGVFGGSLSPSSAASSLEQQEHNYLATSGT
jgi:raffinose/stachyose/melibiose transport system substrate-binding protein